MDVIGSLSPRLIPIIPLLIILLQSLHHEMKELESDELIDIKGSPCIRKLVWKVRS